MATDNFNRSNSTGLGSNWSAPSGLTMHDVVSNAAKQPDGTSRESYWSADSFDGNHESSCTVGGVWPAVRMQSGARSYYSTELYDDGEGGFGLIIYKIVSGTTTTLRDVWPAPTTVGNKWKIIADGTTIKVQTWNGSAWADFTNNSVTDSSLSGGAPGIRSSSSGVTCDDWEGASLGGPAYSGTASASASGSVTPVGKHAGNGAPTVSAAASASATGYGGENRLGTASVSAISIATASGTHAGNGTATASATAGATVTGVNQDETVWDAHTDIVDGLQYAAFGSVDPYLQAKCTSASKPELYVDKGVITRPGEKTIGGRKDIGKGDRVFFKVPNAQLIKGDLTNVDAHKVLLHLTVLHAMTWDNSPFVSEPHLRVRKVDTALDLENCTAAQALAATLGTSYGDITLQRTWLSGQYGWPQTDNSVVPAASIHTIEIDVTAAYNLALGGGTDLLLCLEWIGASDKTIVEFMGSDVEFLKPRLEVQMDWSNVGIGSVSPSISGVETCMPTLNFTVPNPGRLASNWAVEWGYDTDYAHNARNEGMTVGSQSSNRAHTFQFPMLEPSSRVYVRIWMENVSAGNRRTVLKRSFKTPKNPVPKLALKTGTYDWLAARKPTVGNVPPVGESWMILAKSAGNAGQPPVNTWGLWRAINYPDVNGDYKFLPPIGGAITAYPSNNANFDQNAAAHAAHDMSPVTADDAGNPYFDIAGQGAIYFPIIRFNGSTGRYELRVVEILNVFGSATDWFTGAWCDGFVQRESNVIDTFLDAPDLSKSCITRAYGWRNAPDQFDDRDPLLVAIYVRDGGTASRVNVYSKSDREFVVAPHRIANAKYSGLNFTTNWTKEVDSPGSGLAAVEDLYFLEAMTTSRSDRVVLVARTSTGASVRIWSRSRDSYAWDSGSSSYVRTPGTWAGPIIRSCSHVYVTQPVIDLQDGNLPDAHSCFIGIVSSTGVTLVRPDTLTDASILLQLAPSNWGTSGFNNYTFLVDRWPGSYNVSRSMNTASGGAVTLRISGGVLYAQRIMDVCRVSDEVSLAVTGSTILAPSKMAWEGVDHPVVVGVAGSWQVVKVGAAVDVSRLDAPTPDQKWWLSTGDIGLANFVTSDSANMRTPGLAKLPGHNSFGLSWYWDPDSAAYGVMNNAGHLYFKLTGVKGKSLKLQVSGAAVNSAWVAGARKLGITNTGNPSLTDGSTGEAVGGKEWPITKHDTWFYTYDAPGVTHRRWHRIWDTDWITDGEAYGGIDVLTTPVFKESTVWIAHDMVVDPTSWEGMVTTWRSRSADSQDTAYNLVHNVNANGELLHDSGSVASQVFTDVNGRKLTTWVNGPSQITNGDGDNWLGLMIENKSYAKSAKKLVIVQGQEDCEEHTACNVIPAMVDELLSGSALAASLLREFVFLFIPFQNQHGVKNGWSRYQYDTRRESGVIVHYQVGEPKESGWHPWQGESWIGSEFVGKCIDMWATGHADPSTSVFGYIKWHCDTHNRNGGVEKLPPYGNMNWDIASFRSRFDPVVHPEYCAPTFPLVPGTYPSANGSLDANVLSRGGNQFYFELPWRSPAHKPGYWYDETALRNMGVSFLYGIQGVAGWDLYSPSITVSGSASASATGTVGINATGSTAIDSALSTTATYSKVENQQTGEGSTSITSTLSTTATYSKTEQAKAASGSTAMVQYFATAATTSSSGSDGPRRRVYITT